MLVLILSLALQAAPAEEMGRVEFQPTAAEASVPERFRLPASTFEYTMNRRLESPDYSVWTVRFPSPIVTADVENNTVHAEYFRPNRVGAGKGPAVVVLHILGADFALSRYMAVRLAELRLWLAVVADDPADRASQVRPLPNLDCLIRQGDSLLDPLGAVSGLALPGVEAVRLLRATRHQFLDATGSQKRDGARALRRAEVAAARECMMRAAELAELRVAECLGEARALTLFGDRRGLEPGLRRRLRAARDQLQRLRRHRRRLEDDGEVPWFRFETHFADVFAGNGGFDLVVGNPPWVRAEDLPTEVREQLARRYQWWRAAGTRGYRHQPDLAVAFLERGLEIARPGGVVAFLLPAKLATAGYAAAARRALGSASRLHVIADLTAAAGTSFEATVYPLALVAAKEAPSPAHLVREALAPQIAPCLGQAGLLGGAPWTLASPELRAALAGIRDRYPTIAERFSLLLGVKTGANRVFLDPDTPIEPELVRWALRGRDIQPFRARGRIRIIWTHDAWGRPYPRLPALARRYFAAHLASLTSRADYLNGPPWSLFRTAGARARHRVVWPDLGRRLTALFQDGGDGEAPIPLNSCYLVAASSAGEAEAFSGWLNSSWIRAAARAIAMPASGGFARFNAGAVGGLPLPEGVLCDLELARLARAGALGHDVQEELDARCAHHLGLAEEDRLVLLGAPGVADSGDRR